MSTFKMLGHLCLVDFVSAGGIHVSQTHPVLDWIWDHLSTTLWKVWLTPDLN